MDVVYYRKVVVFMGCFALQSQNLGFIWKSCTEILAVVFTYLFFRCFDQMQCKSQNQEADATSWHGHLGSQRIEGTFSVGSFACRESFKHVA